MFAWLKELANAENVESFDARLEQLRASDLWQGNTKLAQYLEREWLSCVPHWADYHRMAYHGGINTNNYMESMNHVIKSKWLSHRVDQRLDTLIKMWADEVEPFYARGYIHDNIKSLRCVPFDGY